MRTSKPLTREDWLNQLPNCYLTEMMQQLLDNQTEDELECNDTFYKNNRGLSKNEPDRVQRLVGMEHRQGYLEPEQYDHLRAVLIRHRKQLKYPDSLRFTDNEVISL